MTHYLVYHPRRVVTSVNGVSVHHDSFRGNQDPYVWNGHFLHSYCHITEMRLEPSNLTIWVSGDTFPKFTALYCDLVFQVLHKCYWSSRNSIKDTDPIVDSPAAFADHYAWAHQHKLVRRRRYTLKADPELSWQPQLQDGRLPDLLPTLIAHGLSLDTLRRRLGANIGSRPMPLEESVARSLVAWLEQNAHLLLRGSTLAPLRSAAIAATQQAISERSSSEGAGCCS